MSDGEMQIGTTWESALIAAHHKLDNLIVIVDKNDWQAMGKTEEILNVNPWLFLHALDWCTTEVNGHDFYAIYENLVNNSEHKLHHSTHKMPKVIIAKTIKGKGVSFFEGNNEWHYRNIDKESYELAQQELR